MWIDSHCHLDHKRMLHLGCAAQVTGRAREAGVTGMLSACCRISDEFPDLVDTIRTLSGVWCSVGTHPHEAGDPDEKIWKEIQQK